MTYKTPLLLMMKAARMTLIMKSIVFFLATLLLFTKTIYGQKATGLIIDDEGYDSVKLLSPSQNFTITGEPVFSLRPYCPMPGNQGDMESCVGWSVAYGAYTTAISRLNNNTDKKQITEQAYSALFLFNQIKTKDCKHGARLEHAFEFLKNTGVCRLQEFNPVDCQVKPDSVLLSIAKGNRIKSYLTLFPLNVNTQRKVALTIRELQHGRPVVIGMIISDSFEKVGRDGLLKPDSMELLSGAHAMCVVGYDNIMNRFEILNSWGPDYGDEGFLYISYEDYARYCRYAFTFKVETGQPDDLFEFKGNYYLNKMVGKNRATGKYLYEKVEAERKGEYYYINDGVLRLNSYFKVIASEMTEGNALYIFSIKPDGSSELLFPTIRERSKGVSVSDNSIILDNDSYIELPSETAIKADQAGDDSLIFLYSKNELDDPELLVKKIAGKQGEIMSRLYSVLGDKLVPADAIKYQQDKMQFQGISKSGSIVPVILKVKINP